MSAPRLLYSKAEIKLLAGAPGALARPPNLLAAVDRFRYEKNILPDRGHASVKTHHKNQKQRHTSHVSSQISPTQQRWKPKPYEQRSGGVYAIRHWDQTPALAEDDEEEPEWADEVVDYNENFDFSQATLERDKEKLEQPAAPVDASHVLPASVPKMSRFGFALEDTILDSDTLSQMRPSISAASEPVQSTDLQPLEYSQARHSRFQFRQTSRRAGDDFLPAMQQQSAPMISARHKPVEDLHSENLQARFVHQHGIKSYPHGQFRPEEIAPANVHTQLYPAHIPSVSPHGAILNHPPASAPKGKPIEVSQMFQMYALANSLPPTPSTHPVVSSQPMVSPSHHGIQTQRNLQPSPNHIPALSNMSAYRPNTMPANVYNMTLPGPPPPGFRPGLSGPQTASITARPLTIAGLGHTQPQPSSRQIPQPASARSKSSSSESRRNKDDSGQSSNRAKAPVPAPAAPPSYVRSYMNIQIPQQPANASYYVPPGMTISPAQGFMGQHMPYSSHPPPAQR